MSKDKIIPELRFPEFEKDSEWEEKALSKVSDVTMGSSPKSSAYNENKIGLPLLQGNADIKNRLSAPRIYTSEVTKECKKGDILLSVRAPVGTVAKSIHHACIGRGISAIQAKDKNSQEFLYQWLFSFESAWKNISQGGTFDAVNSDDIRSLSIPIPQPPEQQKIASCLSSLDELIAAHNDKLDALKDHKKGLMQNLFPQEGETVPKVRFQEFEGDGEWLVRSIEKNIDLISGIALKSKEITDDKSGTPILRGINITEGQIRHTEEMDKFFLGDTSEIEKYLVEENDIVIGMDGSKVGKNVALISKQDAGSILIQRVACMKAINSDVNYLYQHFVSDRFRSYVDIVNTSSGIPHISAKQIRDFEIGFPPKIQEQHKIASCLSALDELITAQAEKLEQLQLHKKGLMQGLFPRLSD